MHHTGNNRADLYITGRPGVSTRDSLSLSHFRDAVECPRLMFTAAEGEVSTVHASMTLTVSCMRQIA